MPIKRSKCSKQVAQVKFTFDVLEISSKAKQRQLVSECSYPNPPPSPSTNHKRRIRRGGQSAPGFDALTVKEELEVPGSPGGNQGQNQQRDNN